MKCKKCGSKVVINMRQHKLGLCSEHFLQWFWKQTQRFIEKYKMFEVQDRLLIAVSGGKDSLALWDVLHHLGYKADGLYIHLGINHGISYSQRSLQKAQEFAQNHHLKLIIADIEEMEGATIPEAARYTFRGKEKPCSTCGITKRHVMNSVAQQGEYDVLATGHNLDDEVAVLFGNVLNWQMGYVLRQYPVLESNPTGFIRKVKPCFRFYERETAAYAFLRGIEYIHDECPYAEGAKTIYYKEILNQMEAKSPSLKQNFYLSFLRAKEKGYFSEKRDIRAEDFNHCKTCGQPTSAPEQCAYCKMWERTRLAKATTEQ